MKFRLAIAALMACVVAAFTAPVAGAAMQDGHDGRVLHATFCFWF